MRGFYRLPLPLPTTAEGVTALPSGVLLSVGEAFAWVLAESVDAPDLVAIGGILLGERLGELEEADRAMCADPETGVPRTIFAGDALEDYL